MHQRYIKSLLCLFDSSAFDLDSYALADGVIHVWDRKFGTKLGELVPEDAIPGQIVDSVIWSQDQALLAIAYNKGSIRIFQVPTVLGLQDRGVGQRLRNVSHRTNQEEAQSSSGTYYQTNASREGQSLGHRRNVSSPRDQRDVSLKPNGPGNQDMERRYDESNNDD